MRYHDLAATHYDSKWGIDYGEQGQAQVVGKLRKALGARPGASAAGSRSAPGPATSPSTCCARAWREYMATDISPGMLAVLEASAERLGTPVETACCQAAELPFEDNSFDLVFGHAVLHHLPDLEAAFREFRRVLRPGGWMAFCGEPSRYGDRLARCPSAGLRPSPAGAR